MNIIEVRNLCYAYEDDAPALDNVSLNIAAGKTTAVLGGNGAGKSTLFLNLNGVLTPKSGKVFFEGTEVRYSKKELPELRRKIGIVFQDPDDQLFSASVTKDISFGLMKFGLTREEIQERVDRVVRQTGIEHIVGKPTHALSFGQKKRVAIAGILVMQPSVIILDEPTAGLDPQGVSEILHLLRDIKETTGITVIISTHDIDLVPLYCDDVIVLDKGRVIFSGTPEQLFAEPELLRSHNLRLPRINHLMNILHNKDHLDVDTTASTISAARVSIKNLLSTEENI
ncbi:MAG: ATP-binding cassette domain-containing protein [Oscillospiraceae bacterium]|jgi:cobalt/nickel transport system ATP-binding protein